MNLEDIDTLHIGHPQVAVGRDDRRIQHENPVEDADGLAVIPLPAALHTFLEEAHGLGVRGFGDRRELDDEDALADGKVGPLEQARFIRTNTLDDLPLRQRGQVGGVEKLEVGEGNEKDHGFRGDMGLGTCRPQSGLELSHCRASRNPALTRCWHHAPATVTLAG